MTGRRIGLGLSVLLLGVLSACGASQSSNQAGQGQSPAGSSAAGSSVARAAATITISSYEYHTSAKVPPGATVLVRNKDDVSHTVTSKADGLFDDTATGGSTTHFTAPSKPGHYDFYCKYHANMHGVLVVAG